MDAFVAEEKYGKITRPGIHENIYASVDRSGVLRWHDDNGEHSAVGVKALKEQDWGPFYKGIRPEKAGERWRYKLNSQDTIIVVDGIFGDLKELWPPSGTFNKIKDTMIHGKNGWERVYPVVGVSETVVLDDVFWEAKDKFYAVPDQEGDPSMDDVWRDLPNKGKCKMTLEFKKDDC